jgi:hypothetical protein
VSLPAGREILHVLPQDFVVDEQDGIGAPVGMTGARLEVNVHIVTGSQSSSTQNIVACVNRAGVEVVDTVIEQLAAAESVLTPDEKELGVALVDIGGGTADWRSSSAAASGTPRCRRRRRPLHQRHRGRPAHADSRGREGQAARGCALSAMVDEDETIEVASVGGRRPRVMARRILSEILQPRAEEIFHLVWDEIRKAGYEKSLNSGIVLTGGGAMLEGMSEIAEQIFDLPIRRGAPVGRRRPGRSRQQPRVCDRGRAGAVRARNRRTRARRRRRRRGRGRMRRRERCSRNSSERGEARWRIQYDTPDDNDLMATTDDCESDARRDDARARASRSSASAAAAAMPSTAWCRPGFDGVEFIVANTDAQALRQQPGAGQDPDRREADQGARRGRRSERRPAGGARGHRQDHPGARGRRHGVRHHRPRRRHRHRRRAGHRQPGQRARRADHRRRHQAVQVRGQEAPTQAERGLEALRDCVDTSSRSPTSGCCRSSTAARHARRLHDRRRRAAAGDSGHLGPDPGAGLINLDFADVKTIMSGMGVAMMGTAQAEGEDRAMTRPTAPSRARCSRTRRSTARAASSST